ncbi:MAG: hypothetical protein JST19_13900 [Bacteroidetes bacterium]|nr:hypothetical protein [Bacteroidota bacterium]
MTGKEHVLDYVARMMNISREKAADLTGLADDAVREVLDPDHVEDRSPERKAELEFEEGRVNLAAIAAKLHLPPGEFSSWTEDEMIFIEYGRNLAEGIAAQGPTCLSATASFFCRWYADVIVGHRSVLLSDDGYHYYDERGEV